MGEHRWLVAGGQNLDHLATASTSYIAGDSNRGTIEVRAGGVGLNMARNVRALGGRVFFCSACGDDAAGAALTDVIRAADVDDRYVLVRDGFSTSRYVAVHDETGEMVAAVNDMAVFDALTPEAIADWCELTDADGALLDANLSSEVLDALSSSWTCPLFADAVSIVKAPRLLPIMGRLRGIKLNRHEAMALTDLVIETMDDAATAAELLLDMGASSVCLSMSVRGALFADGARMMVGRPPEDAVWVNTTGAGDAMAATFAWTTAYGAPLRDIATWSMAAATLTAASSEPVDPDLTRERVEIRAKTIPFDII
ncbi:MAG: PfkB family carbohydrate kinase [Saccharofermentanales bacterium]|jgi:pseudouridine kinase